MIECIDCGQKFKEVTISGHSCIYGSWVRYWEVRYLELDREWGLPKPLEVVPELPHIPPQPALDKSKPKGKA